MALPTTDREKQKKKFYACSLYGKKYAIVYNKHNKEEKKSRFFLFFVHQ